MKRKAIILLSGGLDSSTVVKIAKNDGFSEIYALTFNYGQRNIFEEQAAKHIATENNVTEHKIINIDLSCFGGSSLTTDLKMEKGREIKDIGIGIPSTYVPARNTLFLTYALSWAEVIPAYDIYIGANNVDYSGYPDCRPDYFRAFELMANLATKIGVEGQGIKIHTPLIDLTKKDIILLGLSLGVDYSRTNTCYNPTNEALACGECDACILRKNAFQELGMTDPIGYV